jgi:DNA mismatch endonuclease (patch repair protein)
MTDTLSVQERSANMRLIKSKNTGPELIVRKICCELGHRGYRLYRKNLPGKPDIAFIGRKTALFVNGCFWHGHNCRKGSRTPKQNVEYWSAKIARNQERDAEHQDALRMLGWKFLVIWECELKDKESLIKKIQAFLES